jgi:hypothetical protein
MKVTLPKDTNEIVIVLMSLIEEMTHLKEDVRGCQKSIADHATEARIASKSMNDTVQSMQFSVNSLQTNMNDVQDNLEQLIAISTNLSSIWKILSYIAKTITWIGGIMIVIMAFIKFRG